MFSSNCCFLTCIQISQEAGQVVWYSHLFQNFPQCIMIHTVKGFRIVNKAEIDVFLELSCFFHDPADVGNLISGSSAFSKTSLNIWKLLLTHKSWLGNMGCISKHPTLQVNHQIVPVAIATANASRSFSSQSHLVSKLPCNKWIYWLHKDSCIIFWSRNAFSVQWALFVPSILQHLPSLIYVSQSNDFQKEGSFLKTLASCLSPQGKWCDLSDYWAWGKR